MGDSYDTHAQNNKSRAQEQLIRSMHLSSKDPCAGTNSQNAEAVKEKLMKQRVWHHEFASGFTSKKQQRLYKEILQVPDIYLRGLSTQEKEYDSKYLSKLPNYSDKNINTPKFKNQAM